MIGRKTGPYIKELRRFEYLRGGIMDRIPPLDRSTRSLRPYVGSFAKWLLPAAVLLLAAVLYLAKLGDRALWSEELRWVEIPREMLVNRDFFSPTINWHSYYDKPLGSYWLVLAASLFMGAVDETAARLPCAVSGILSVGLLMLIARRLFDRRTAILAGLVLATSFSFVFFARNASADMENLTGMLATIALLLRFENLRGGWWVVGLWLIMATTSLTKGLLGFALPLLVYGVDSCLRNGWSALADETRHGSIAQRVASLARRFSWLLNRWSLLAVPLAVAAFLLPFAISGRREGLSNGLDLVYRENVKRFFNPHNHRGPIYLYAYVILELMAPWSLFLPAALAQAHHVCRAGGVFRRGDRFLLAFFWGIFAFFTLAASRRSYYLLPILPAGAMLVARLLTTPREQLCRSARILLVAGFGTLAIAVAGATIAFLASAWRPAGISAGYPALPGLPILAVLWLACLATIPFALWRFDSRWIALAAATIALAVLGYLNLVALPRTESLRDKKAFALRAKVRLRRDMGHLAFFRTREPVFYLDQSAPIQEFEDADLLRQAIASGEVRWLIIREEHLSFIPAGGEIVDRESSFPWENSNRVAGKLLLVEFRKRLALLLPARDGETVLHHQIDSIERIR